MEFTVILEECEEGGYTVTCPALPGCVSEGDTYEEALQNAREAITGYLEAMEKQARWKVSNYSLATFFWKESKDGF